MMRTSVVLAAAAMAHVVAAGCPKVGPAYLVNGNQTDTEGQSHVVAYEGGYLMVWSSVSAKVFGRVFGCDGEPAGSIFEVGHGVQPRVAVLSDGGFVVGYVRPELNLEVFARVFSEPDAPLAEVQLNNYTRADQNYLSLCGRPDGTFVAVWSSFKGAFETVARVFTGTGAPLTGEVPVHTPLPSGVSALLPSIHCVSTGDVAVSWVNTDDEGAFTLHMRTLDHTLAGKHGDVLVSENAVGGSIVEVMDVLVVSYGSLEGGAHAKFYDLEGEQVGAPALLMPGTLSVPQVAVDGNVLGVQGDLYDGDSDTQHTFARFVSVSEGFAVTALGETVELKVPATFQNYVIQGGVASLGDGSMVFAFNQVASDTHSNVYSQTLEVCSLPPPTAAPPTPAPATSAPATSAPATSAPVVPNCPNSHPIYACGLCFTDMQQAPVSCDNMCPRSHPYAACDRCFVDEQQAASAGC